jgi:Holliday junction resolvase RusA-like endonuclease
VFTCTFTASGIPRPKGNLVGIRAGNRCLVTEAAKHSKLLKPWMAELRRAALPHLRGEPLTGPLEVEVEFRFPRPANPICAGYPLGTEADVDKLQRAVGDALQHTVRKGRLVFPGLWRDDKTIVRWVASKVFGEPGAQITVRALEPEPEQLQLAAPAAGKPY